MCSPRTPLHVDGVGHDLPGQVRALRRRGRPIPPNNDDLLGSVLHAALAAVTQRPALYDIAAAVNSMIRSAVDLVPGAAAGGISISSAGAGGAHGSTSEEAADLDALQHHHDEGPCLSALHAPRPELTIVVAQDLAGDDEARWPRFAPAAVELGFPAVLSLQLPAASGIGAALNLYGRQTGGFQLADLVLADMFVGHLAHLLFGDARPSASSGQRTGTSQEAELRQRLDRPALEP